MASALLGARPSELAKGIKIRTAHDEGLNYTVLCLHAEGLKVKQQQGQPNRCVSYAIDDPYPLVRILLDEMTQSGKSELTVAIENPGNYSTEIQRLARSLWPKHDQTITAYCFRHQWSADVKATGDTDAATRGLGHRSTKTWRLYGTTLQTRRAHCLRPVRIEAERPVSRLRSNVQSIRAAPQTE